MKDKLQTSESQVVSLQDFSVRQLATILSKNPAWVKINRDLFKWYRIPGRGPAGYEFRFTRKSVVDYVERLRAGANGNGSHEGKTAEQIISDVKARRALAGESL